MFPSAKMAENPVQPLVDKMVVNSVDHRITGEPSLSSASRSSMDVNFSAKQSLPKLNSFDGAQTPSPIPGLRPPTGKKSSFQITRVITKPNDFNIDDQETDDLDETNTEDMSSDILDISKTSGVIEPDPSSEDTVEMAPEAEESSNARDVNPKPPPQPPQEEDLGQIEEKDKLGDGSRFKVVKIESKEPFRRGRWKCLDFLDPPPTSEKVVFSEKLTERTSEENFVGSGNSSAASSVHYVPGVDDPSKNPLSTSATYIDDYTNSIVEPQPVYPGGYQPQSQQMTNGIGIDFAQGSVPHQSTPNMPLYDSQNTSSMGAGPSQSGQPSAAPSTETLPSSISSQPPGSSQQSMPSQPPSQSHVLSAQVPTTITHNHIPPPSSLPGDLSSQSLASSSFDATQSGQNVNVSQVGQQGTIHENNDFQQPAASQPQSITQTPLQNQDFDSYQTGTSSQTNLNPNVGAAASQTNVNPTQTTVSSGDVVQSPGQVSQAGSGAPSKNTSPNDEKVQGNDFMSQDRGYATGPAIPEKKSEVVPIETRRVDEMNLFKSAAGLTPPLLEMVSATMHPHMTAKDDDESGASTVAIDNKIEQAMDLVKSHLMFAVREEVEVLKEQIKELLEKNSQLEYENTILKAAATPETMSKINQSQPPASSS